MNIRWRVAMALGLLAATALGARDGGDAGDGGDGLPDAALDDDDAELALHQEESRNVRPRAYTAAVAGVGGGGYNALPSGFRPTPSLAELAGYQRPPPQHQHALYADQQQFHPQPQPQQQQQQAPQRQPQRKDQRAGGSAARLQAQELQQELDDEEAPEEPDRLSQLLQQSKFQCAGKQTGYYADQELACEIFHYCQDSVKHSWICPDGFTFHQVHLICMPPTHDNICQKSAKYHFVNEYLYRPVNEEEVQRKPNVSLRYSDRYYPAEVYHDDRYEQDEEEEEADARPAPLQAAAPRPARPAPAPQVFRSAEEVNIPLGQRRPNRPYDFDF